MFSNLPILSLVTFLPLVGAAMIALIPADSPVANRNIKNVALAVTVFVFIF